MRLRFSLLFLAIALVPVALTGQTETRPFMAGLSANFYDYQGPLTRNFGQISTFDPGISFAGYGYISNAFNYSLSTTFVPEVVYPTSENTFISTSMLDVKGLFRWTIINPDRFFVPYIGTGIGLNTASNNLRWYVPASVGFRLKFTENFGLQWESTWQQPINTAQFQPVSHMVGFVFALPTTREPSNKDDREPEPNDAPIAALPDRDADGVPDRDDQCPDEKGLLMYLGCPEPEVEEPGTPVIGEPAATVEDPAVSQPGTDGGATISQPPIISPDPVGPSPSPGPMPDDAEIAALNMELQNVYFDHASFELTPDARRVLDRAAEILRSHPNLSLQVMGHTDNSGNERDNIVLSIQRAYKVKYYLVYEKRIPMSRITSDGYSSVEPVGTNETEQGRAMNRRVELQLMKKPVNSGGISPSRGSR